MASDSCLEPAENGSAGALDRAGLRARDYVAHSRAENTKRAYRADWSDFQGWCTEHGRASLPASPETVALYLSARAETLKASTLQRRIATISQAHQAANLGTPTRSAEVRTVWRGICRVHGTAQEGKAAAVTSDVALMVATLPRTLLGIRDRALLLLGFAGAYRRSELVSLDVEDLELKRDGYVVHLRRSKTDQAGEGLKKGIPYGAVEKTCPVRAVKRWLAAAELASGPLFRRVDRHGCVHPGYLGDRAVALVVKRSALAAGLDPARYAGHSLRAGLATSAGAAGVPERAIMAQTGHKSERMVRKYIREGRVFKDNAAGQVGL
jgi:site-specific recombinase XerD